MQAVADCEGGGTLISLKTTKAPIESNPPRQSQVAMGHIVVLVVRAPAYHLGLTILGSSDTMKSLCRQPCLGTGQSFGWKPEPKANGHEWSRLGAASSEK